MTPALLTFARELGLSLSSTTSDVGLTVAVWACGVPIAMGFRPLTGGADESEREDAASDDALRALAVIVARAQQRACYSLGTVS